MQHLFTVVFEPRSGARRHAAPRQSCHHLGATRFRAVSARLRTLHVTIPRRDYEGSGFARVCLISWSSVSSTFRTEASPRYSVVTALLPAASTSLWS